MNEQEQKNYETELRRAQPARLPDHFMARLQAARPGAELARRTPLQPVSKRAVWRSLWRWLAPVMALGVVAVLASRVNVNPESSVDNKPLAAAYGLKADDVQVDQELVSSFEVVAKLPGGEPVRFRCQEWKDQLVVTDKNRGVEIAESNPRVEVVPMRFETY